MKRRHRLLSAVLAAVLFLSPSALAGSPVDGIGELLRRQSIYIGSDAMLTETTMWHAAAGREEERYIEVSPSSNLTPVVAYGNKLYGKSTISAVANHLTGLGHSVYAGINADFFSLETGLPLGVVITDGVLRSHDAGAAAVGFLPDGSAFIGNPYISTTLTTGAESIKIDYINKLRQPYSVYLLTSDFSTATQSRAEGLDIVLGSVSGPLRVGGSVTAVVEAVHIGLTSVPIEEGKMVISVDLTGPVERVAALAVGMPVEISLSSGDARWAQATHAVGGQKRLITNGVADQSLGQSAAPRSAIGVKPDGSYVLYVVDGRRAGHSSGISLSQLAQRMASLGCVDAIELDGGGSTAMTARYPGTADLGLVNKPSDGGQRQCANYIFLVNSSPATGTVDRLHIYPYEQYMLKNSYVQLELRASDRNWHAVTPPGADMAGWEVSGPGAIGAGGLLTAGEGSGELSVTASYGGASGSTSFTVLENVTKIELSDQASGKAVTRLTPGLGSQLNLTAEATLDGLRVPSQRDESFTWAVTGEIGSIDQSGLYTASLIPGATGTITCSYGDFTASVEVTVERDPELVTGFEQAGASDLFLQAGGGAVYGIESDKQHVRFGDKAARISYTVGGAVPAELSSNIALPGGTTYINMFVYGDGSGNILSLQITGADGVHRVVQACTLNFTGYRRIQVPVSGGASQIKGLALSAAGDQPSSGVIFIDQILAAFGPFEDDIPPEITLTASGLDDTGVLHVLATITDGGRPVRPETVRVQLNGVDYPFLYSDAAGTLTVNVAEYARDRLNRLSITAADIAGNLQKRSVDIEPSAAASNPFDDTDGHWARDYAAFLYGKGIVDGADEGGQKWFYPNKVLTRAEFAKIMAAKMGLNLSYYSPMVLPYVDLGSIPSWAMDSVKAMYANGIMRGKDEATGVYFDPNAPLTRAELMTILGRSLPKGYSTEPAPFTDAQAIPGYAREYVYTLYNLGVVGGYEDGSISPLRSVTRGEAARMLYSSY